MKLDYPEHILRPNSDKWIKDGFKYRKAVAYLLSELSGVKLDTILNANIHTRSLRRYRPWYPTRKGGGAITLGNKRWHNITFTENFFSTDKEAYPHTSYGNQTISWLRLSAHEVGHLAHAQRFGSIIIYLFRFIYEYVVFGHDQSPLEKEADIGSNNFKGFQSFLNRTIGPSSIDKILKEDISEADRIEKFKRLLSKYYATLDT